MNKNTTVNQIVRWVNEHLDTAGMFVGGLDDLVDHVLETHGATAGTATVAAAVRSLTARTVTVPGAAESPWW